MTSSVDVLMLIGDTGLFVASGGYLIPMDRPPPPDGGWLLVLLLSVDVIVALLSVSLGDRCC